MSDAPEDDLILPLYIIYTLAWMAICLLTLPLVIVRQLVCRRFGIKAATTVVMVASVICSTAWAVHRTNLDPVAATKPGNEWYMVTGTYTDVSSPKGGGPKLVWYQYVDPVSHKAGYLTLDYYKGMNHPRELKGWVSQEHSYFYTLAGSSDENNHAHLNIILALIMGLGLGWYGGRFIDMMIKQIDANIALRKAKFAT